MVAAEKGRGGRRLRPGACGRGVRHAMEKSAQRRSSASARVRVGVDIVRLRQRMSAENKGGAVNE